MNAAVAYLESGDYNRTGLRHGFPLLDFLGPWKGVTPDDSEHDDWLCDRDDLCTGDGFRWNPAVPELRFT